MKKTILISMLLCLAITLTAKVSLYVVLDKVAKEPNVKAAMKVGEDGTFGDALIAITWEARPDGFYFALTNKTNGKLLIPWDECRFVDETGANCAVIHGVAGAVLEIEANGSISSALAPADYFYWTKKGWTIQNIFLDKMSDEEFDAVKDKDLLYQVILPVRRDKVKTVYHFLFKTVAK
jgi:hypothetical protein